MHTIIEVRPHGDGWKVFEAAGVEPVFPRKEYAMNYATGRARSRSGEIRILDSDKSVEKIIPFSELSFTTAKRQPELATAAVPELQEDRSSV
jgi:hypothetical protein